MLVNTVDGGHPGGAVGLRSTDGDLALRARSGEEAAFASLMCRHQGWALRYIRRHTKNTEDAHDLLQETFISAWRALQHYQRERPFDAWLRRIALNKCRDRGRRESVRRAIGGYLTGAEVLDVADSAPGPATCITGEQELQHVERSLQTLSQSLRQPLLLTAIDGLSHIQAGKRLGMSAKAVEMRVHRARALLQQLCGRHGKAGGCGNGPAQ